MYEYNNCDICPFFAQCELDLRNEDDYITCESIRNGTRRGYQMTKWICKYCERNELPPCIIETDYFDYGPTHCPFDGST